ncbi:MAG: radical SAM protein [bacterium]
MSAPVLLVHPPCPDVPPMYYGPPYGIALIAACLERRERPVLCRDFERSSTEQMVDECLRVVGEHRVQVVGIGGTSTSRGPVYELVRALRTAHPDLTIVLGGPFATPLHRLLLTRLPIDYVVLGDGEVTLPALLDHLEQGGDPADLAGIAFRRGDEVIRTADRPRVTELDSLPYPAFERFEVERSLSEHQSFLASRLGHAQLTSIKGKRCSSIPSGLMLLSSYGCTYSCVFCPMSGVQRGRYRQHSATYFVDMLEHFAKRYGLRHFIFGDNLFTGDRERARTICDEILARGLDVAWMCMTRTDHVDDALLLRMHQAGCVEIIFGVESCAETVQASIRKGLDLSTVAPALAGCDRASIRSLLSLMVGNPGDTEETIYETLARVRELEPDEAQVKITKVYPGTKLHALAVEAGILREEDYLDPDPHPPPYTVEHTAAALEGLAALIRPRTLHLETTARPREGSRKDRPLQELERDLLRVARRSAALRFRAESARREDLAELLRTARELRIPTLELVTDARVFAEPGRLEALADCRVDRFYVVFPTHDEAMHDQVTHAPGALAERVAGLQRILRGAPDRVTAQVELLAATLPRIEETIRFLVDLGVRDFQLLYAPTAQHHAPAPETLADGLEPALARLRDTGASVAIHGAPPCFLPAPAATPAELHEPFDELLDLDGRLINLGKTRRRLRRQTDRCDGCPFQPRCEGFWIVDLERAPGSS